ncbi:hypothetical protein THIOKS13300014 [Thiocapsa sp. KS1]|nr:hypothetical protein THIOKS13300014 [Thiocapsa sp. KS1]
MDGGQRVCDLGCGSGALGVGREADFGTVVAVECGYESGACVELAYLLSVRHPRFLSCLCGSEPIVTPTILPQSFLSCLCGSELVALATYQFKVKFPDSAATIGDVCRWVR